MRRMVALAVLLFVAACSPHRTVFRATNTAWQTVGYTDWFCADGVPYGWVRSDVRGDSAVAASVHEEDHVAYAKEHFTTCQQWAHATRLRDVLVDLESRAYCVEAHWWFDHKYYPTLPAAIAAQAPALSHGYPFNLTEPQAYSLITAQCRKKYPDGINR